MIELLTMLSRGRFPRLLAKCFSRLWRLLARLFTCFLGPLYPVDRGVPEKEDRPDVRHSDRWLVLLAASCSESRHRGILDVGKIPSSSASRFLESLSDAVRRKHS